MRARDVMTKNVITVPPTMPVTDVAQVLLRYNIGGVPVVDSLRRLIGIISSRDIFLKEEGLPYSAVRIPSRFARWVEPDQLEEIYRQGRTHTAADIMTRDVVWVQHLEPVVAIARLMSDGDLKRLPVLDRERVVGIVTRLDLLRVLQQPVRAAWQGRLADATPDRWPGRPRSA